MANTDNNTVQLSVSTDSPYIEGIVGVGHTITPGALIRLQWQNNWGFLTNGGEICESTFAVENTYMGGTINDTYAEGERVMVRSLRGGDEFLAWLGLNQDIHIGDILVGTLDGYLRDWFAVGDHVLAVALEELVTTATPVRMRVRIL